jgi:hypothetical protein
MATRAMMMCAKTKKSLRNLLCHGPHFSSRAQFNQACHFPTGQAPTGRVLSVRILTVQVSIARMSIGHTPTGRKLSIPSEKILPRLFAV